MSSHAGISSVLYNVFIDINSKCLFQFINSSNSETYILFANNSAANGGDDIYGATLSSCQFYQTGSLNIRIDRVGPPSLSSVSSDPQRVCLCDDHGAPQCSTIYNSRKVHPGESFTVSAIIVGWDYPNTTTGVIHTDILDTGNSMVPKIDLNSQRGHVISNSKQCINISFSFYLIPNSSEKITMYINAVHMDTQTAHDFVKDGQCYSKYPPYPPYCRHKEHLTPVFFNVTIFPCPAGFKPLYHNQSCDC